MKKKIETRGGARPNAGRHKIDDPKEQVNVMIPGSYLNKLTKQEVQVIMKEAVAAKIRKL